MPDRSQREIEGLLKGAGAVLERKRKHCIWRFPDRRIWVVPSSPSDDRAYRNNLADLRRYLKANP
jgi:hypothetical protein